MNRVIGKEAFRLSEFSEAYGISRTKIYDEINLGRLRVFKIGRRTAISREAAHDWVQLCESESPNANREKSNS